MSTTTTTRPVTRVTTGKVRLSYFKGWKPEAMEEGADPKYSTAILIPKSDTKTIEAIEAGCEFLEAAEKAKNKGKLPPKWKRPLRDGDEEKPDDANYAGMMFLNASSKNKPGIVGLERDEAGKLKKIEDEDQVYSGAYARVSLNLYAFDVKGNRGIAAGLENIQKVADGEKLDGGGNPDADFEEEYEPEEDALD